VEVLSLNDSIGKFSKNCRDTLSRLPDHYRRLLRSRQQWVGFASQSFFHNPYLAAMDMFFVHPGALHGALSRCFANGWAALGTCGFYSHGRDKLFKKLGLLRTDTFKGCIAAILVDTTYGFLLNVPAFVTNYALAGCGLLPSVILGIKASGAACWTSFISGALFDSFAALDSDDAQKRSRAPAWVRWLVIDRFELKTRKKLIWIALAASVLLTAAIYSFAPGGLMR
jgi:hypothetical protein